MFQMWVLCHLWLSSVTRAGDMPVSRRELRGIVVLDVGATNVKGVLLDAGLSLHAEESVPSVRRGDPPYLSIDTQPIIDLARTILPQFDSILPVDAIVPCAHGSAAALLDSAGELALPIMSYEAEPPEEIVSGYAEIAPRFEEVFAPTNPLALTLGRQLHWQETLFPDAFARATTILPLAQYVAFRLYGRLANEVSAMGAQTHLWAPLRRDYSALARRRNWSSRFPPLRPAWQSLGCARDIPVRGRAHVLTGVHDSNANLLPYLSGKPATLLSTGNWIIGCAQGIDIETLDPARDQVSNTTVFGDPIASCRFMGGRELEIVSDGAPPELASTEAVGDLLDRGVSAWPSFTTSGGPVPNSGGRGRIEGIVENARERASLAALYCAQMSALALEQIGANGRVIVDGPFAAHETYLRVLAACLPDQEVLAATGKSGTAVGAAALALLSVEERARIPAPDLRRITTPRNLENNDKLRRWFDKVDSL